eukprot:scaffold1199_cov265-Pinguiococcus_pyrenoidosus.AAC.15
MTIEIGYNYGTVCHSETCFFLTSCPDSYTALRRLFRIRPARPTTLTAPRAGLVTRDDNIYRSNSPDLFNKRESRPSSSLLTP